jgi:hypothetical protein
VVLLHERVAVRRLDAPDAEHDRALDTEVLLDAAEERLVFLCLFLAGDDAPVRDPTIEVLPELLVELGLIVDRLEAGFVRAQAVHGTVVCFGADAAGERLGAETRNPFREVLGGERQRRGSEQGRRSGQR